MHTLKIYYGKHKLGQKKPSSSLWNYEPVGLNRWPDVSSTLFNIRCFAGHHLKWDALLNQLNRQNTETSGELCLETFQPEACLVYEVQPCGAANR